MPRDEKNFKRRVRARMAKTGESYTAARAQLERGGAATAGVVLRVGDVLELVHELPDQLGVLRVVTREQSEAQLSGLANDRVEGLVATRLPSETVGPSRVAEAVTWMDFTDSSWTAAPLPPMPRRWREERHFTDSNGDEHRFVRAAEGRDSWLQDATGVYRDTGDVVRSTPTALWVVDTRWPDGTSLEVRDPVTIAGRDGIVVRVTPRSRPASRPRVVFGDATDVVVDVATGLTLAMTSFLDGVAFAHREVVELELSARLPTELVVPPSGITPTPRGGAANSLEALAEMTELVLLTPQQLPPGYRFTVGGRRPARVGGGIYLNYSTVGPEGYLLIHEVSDSGSDPEPYAWHHVERDGRDVWITDVGSQSGRRIAYVTQAGTRASIRADLPVADLVNIAAHMAPHEPPMTNTEGLPAW